ncbi:MAG: lipase family protein [Nevskia sp.]|nr:lipase family protein [Nevskia sp.]
MDRLAAAKNALLIMYAWDMCAANLRNLAPDPARVSAAGWTVAGFISGSDDILRSGLGLRTAMLGGSSDPQDRVCYGYAARRNNQYVAVIRGTDGAEEWGDDCDFLMTAHPDAGLVDQGFWSIYDTMKFRDLAGNESRLADGIKAAAGAAPVMVLGHSLGAALATYLTLELNLEQCPASACLFASPRTGNQTFVDFFESKVANYDLFNYERDVVPTVPFNDVLHFSNYHPLAQAKTIPAAGASAAIQDNPGCNHHLICYTALLDPDAYKSALSDPACTGDDHSCAQCVLSTSA